MSVVSWRTLGTSPLRPAYSEWLPALLLIALLTVVGRFGQTSVPGMVATGVLVAGLGLFALVRAPVLVFLVVPLSMAFYVRLPIAQYELAVALLAGLLATRVLARTGVRRWHADPVEWRSIVFLGSLALQAPRVASLWRFFSQFKIFALGVTAYALARQASGRLGRRGMMWGPALFCALTGLQVMWRLLSTGVPIFKSILLRSYLTDLTWGHANGVAAVMVTCVPGMVWLARNARARSLEFWAAWTALGLALFVVFIAAARGPLLLSFGYILWTSSHDRRRLGLTLLIATGIGLLLFATPLGSGVVHRFTDSRASEGVIFRLMTWHFGWARMATHFPWGVGLGQGVLQQDGLRDIDCHNWILTLLSELGLLSALLWGWLAAGVWQAAGRLEGRTPEPGTGLAIRGTLLLALAGSMVEPTLTGNLHHLLFWWVLGSLRGTESLDAGEALTPAAAATVQAAG